MTDNENKARKILDSCFQSGEPDELFHVIKKLATELPSLTDDECYSIAVNYPASVQGVRDAFPRAKI